MDFIPKKNMIVNIENMSKEQKLSWAKEQPVYMFLVLVVCGGENMIGKKKNTSAKMSNHEMKQNLKGAQFIKEQKVIPPFQHRRFKLHLFCDRRNKRFWNPFLT